MHLRHIFVLSIGYFTNMAQTLYDDGLKLLKNMECGESLKYTLLADIYG